MSDEQLRPFIERPDRAGIFLDFDGTLSEIVPIPSQARPIEGAAELLDELAKRFAVVAIVSGRAATDLVEWLGPNVEIWGVHGAQRATNGRVELSPKAQPFEAQMKKIHDEATERLRAEGIDGAIVEDKAVMVTLHYRAARDPDEAQKRTEALANELAARENLTVTPGRASYELRPGIDFTKAAVIADRAKNLEAVAFAGDDTVDLPGFDALDTLAIQGITTLRIAVRSPEAPRELLDRADIIVDGPAGALNLLRKLTANVR